jgi:Family of unknown function (DUF6519)
MKGDFSIDRFDSTKHYNRVLKQQGRVDLDADWNEQASIAQYALRTAIADMFGAAAGPRDNCGFAVVDWTALSAADRDAMKKAGLQPAVGDFIIGAGRYYVDGLLVENDAPVAYSGQPEWRGPKLVAGKSYLAYLDVWERHITFIEDDSIREVALGGPDTCTRVKTVWQVKVTDAVPDTDFAAKVEALKRQLADENARVPRNAAAIKRIEAQLTKLLKQPEGAPTCASSLKAVRDWTSGHMRAQLEPGKVADSPCVLSPESRYRGLENQLYRIEVHRGSKNPANKSPTFKWSRENGSVATRWLGNEGNALRVTSSRGFSAGDWIEVTDTTAELQGDAGTLLQILTTDGDLITVDSPPAWSSSLVNPSVRRWDQQANDELKLDAGGVVITPGADDKGWIEIEYGIEVQFSAGEYRTGDYWLIPTRVATGDIIWPHKDGKAVDLAPSGIVHHYAPLALIDATAADPFIAINSDCRCRFAPLQCLSE